MADKPTLTQPFVSINGLYCLCHGESIRYVGQTTDTLNNRLTNHLGSLRYSLSHGRTISYCQRWMVKHGLENIAITLLDVAFSRVELDHLETLWIDSLPNLTNIMPGGSQSSGYKNPKIAERMRGEKNPMYGKDRRELMAYARSFQGPPSQETRRLLSEAGKGRIASEATRKKLSASLSAAWTEERREKQRQLMLRGEGPLSGHVMTDETKQKMSRSRSPLTDDEIREIKRLRSDEGLMYFEIAERIGPHTNKDTEGKICRGERFNWIN